MDIQTVKVAGEIPIVGGRLWKVQTWIGQIALPSETIDKVSFWGKGRADEDAGAAQGFSGVSGAVPG